MLHHVGPGGLGLVRRIEIGLLLHPARLRAHDGSGAGKGRFGHEGDPLRHFSVAVPGGNAPRDFRRNGLFELGHVHAQGFIQRFFQFAVDGDGFNGRFLLNGHDHRHVLTVQVVQGAHKAVGVAVPQVLVNGLILPGMEPVERGLDLRFDKPLILHLMDHVGQVSVTPPQKGRYLVVDLFQRGFVLLF